MKIQSANPEMIIDELEQELAEYFGFEFVENFQDLAGLTSVRAVFGQGTTSKIKREKYLHLLMGAKYAIRANPSYNPKNDLQ